MRYVFLNPANYSQTYVTDNASDPNVPAGWTLSSGSDGAQDMPVMEYQAGINSGGWPPYENDPSQVAVQPRWPNGIFGAKPGSGV